MRKSFWIVVIVLWIVGILFPTAWFSNQFGVFSEHFNQIFSPQWVHIVMHAGLYAMLMVFLSHYGNQKGSTSVYKLWIIIGLIAVTQEILQSVVVGRTFSYSEVFDIFVDFSGAGLGRLVYMVQFNRREESKLSKFRGGR